MTELQRTRNARRPRRRTPRAGAARTRHATGRGHLARLVRTAQEPHRLRSASVMLVLLFGACIATPWIATHDPIKQSYRERLAPPSEKHYLGHRSPGSRHLLAPAVGRTAAGRHRAARGRLRLVDRHPLRRAVRLFRRQGRYGGDAHRRWTFGVPRPAALPADRDPGPGMETRGHLQRSHPGLRAGLRLHAGGGAIVARLGAGGEAEGVCRGVARHRRRQLQHRAQADPAQHHLAADRECHGAPGLRHPDHRRAVVPRAWARRRRRRIGAPTSAPRATTWKPRR